MARIVETEQKKKKSILKGIIITVVIVGLLVGSGFALYKFVFKKEEVELVIQDVEGVGIFIEFEEYESISHLPPKEKIEVLKNTLLSLKLSLGTNFSCKKLELYLNKNKL